MKKLTTSILRTRIVHIRKTNISTWKTGSSLRAIVSLTRIFTLARSKFILNFMKTWAFSKTCWWISFSISTACGHIVRRAVTREGGKGSIWYSENSTLLFGASDFLGKACTNIALNCDGRAMLDCSISYLTCFWRDTRKRLTFFYFSIHAFTDFIASFIHWGWNTHVRI